MDDSLGVKKKKLKRVVSTKKKLNSSVSRFSANVSLSTSMVKQSLRTNNRALARALELKKAEMYGAQKEILLMQEERQQIVERLARLEKVAGCKDSEIDQEVQTRIQARMERVGGVLSHACTNLRSAVDLILEAMEQCEGGVSSRLSSRPASYVRTSSTELSPQPVTSIYYHGPSNKEVSGTPPEIPAEVSPQPDDDPVDRVEDAANSLNAASGALGQPLQDLSVIMERSYFMDNVPLPFTDEDSAPGRVTRSSRSTSQDLNRPYKSKSKSRTSSRRSFGIGSSLAVAVPGDRSRSRSRQRSATDAAQRKSERTDQPSVEQPTTAVVEPEKEVISTMADSADAAITDSAAEAVKEPEVRVRPRRTTRSTACSSASESEPDHLDGNLRRGKKRLTRSCIRTSRTAATNIDPELPVTKGVSKETQPEEKKQADENDKLEPQEGEKPQNATGDKRTDSGHSQASTEDVNPPPAHPVEAEVIVEFERPIRPMPMLAAADDDPMRRSSLNKSPITAIDDRAFLPAFIPLHDEDKPTKPKPKLGVKKLPPKNATNSKVKSSKTKEDKPRKTPPKEDKAGVDSTENSTTIRRRTFEVPLPVGPKPDKKTDSKNEDQLTEEKAAKRRGTYYVLKTEESDDAKGCSSKDSALVLSTALAGEGILGETDDVLINASFDDLAFDALVLPEPEPEPAEKTICDLEDMELTDVLNIDFSKLQAPAFITKAKSGEPTFLATNEAISKVGDGETSAGQQDAEGPLAGSQSVDEELSGSGAEPVAEEAEEMISSSVEAATEVPADVGDVVENEEQPEDKANEDSDLGPAKEDSDVDKDKEDSDVNKAKEDSDDNTAKELSEDEEYSKLEKHKNNKDSEDQEDSADNSEPEIVVKASRSQMEPPRKKFTAMLSKPGKIKFTAGRINLSDLQSRPSKSKTPAYSTLPKINKRSKARLKPKLPEQTANLDDIQSIFDFAGTPQGGPKNGPPKSKFEKSVFDLSMNESIAQVKASKSKPKAEMKTKKKPEVVHPDHEFTKKTSVAESPHGIMLVLGNGKRTKPRARSKQVCISSGMPEIKLTTPAPVCSNGATTIDAGATPLKAPPTITTQPASPVSKAELPEPDVVAVPESPCVATTTKKDDKGLQPHLKRRSAAMKAVFNSESDASPQVLKPENQAVVLKKRKSALATVFNSDSEPEFPDPEVSNEEVAGKKARLALLKNKKNKQELRTMSKIQKLRTKKLEREAEKQKLQAESQAEKQRLQAENQAEKQRLQAENQAPRTDNTVEKQSICKKCGATLKSDTCVSCRRLSTSGIPVGSSPLRKKNARKVDTDSGFDTSAVEEEPRKAAARYSVSRDSDEAFLSLKPRKIKKMNYVESSGEESETESKMSSRKSKVVDSKQRRSRKAPVNYCEDSDGDAAKTPSKSDNKTQSSKQKQRPKQKLEDLAADSVAPVVKASCKKVKASVEKDLDTAHEDPLVKKSKGDNASKKGRESRVDQENMTLNDVAPRCSMETSNRVSEDGEGGRRRRRAAVCYKEPSLGAKLRQGDPGTVTVYKEGQPDGKTNNRQSKGKKVQSQGRKRSVLSTASNVIHMETATTGADDDV